MNFEPLVKLTRGTHNDSPIVEAEHWGAISVVDGLGNEVTGVGDGGHVTHLRSCAKPFQLLPFILADLQHEMWQTGESIETADIALMMSSHSGEPMHVERVKKLLAMASLEENQLLCGSHAPYNDKAKLELLRNDMPWTSLHNNCSGKHVAMLMVCRHYGWSLEDYLSVDHPLQTKIKELISQLSGISRDEIGVGIDGCGVPTFAIPLRAIARLYARLAFPSDQFPSKLVTALQILFDCGTDNPEFIAGTKRLDTLLMKNVPGLFAKTGAEGLFAMSVRPSSRYQAGLGIAIKIQDGDPANRARIVATTQTLCQLGLLSEDKNDWETGLSSLAFGKQQNWQGQIVGEVSPTFHLRRQVRP